MSHFVEIIQQYGPLFGILAAIATVLGVAFKIYKSSHDQHVIALKDDIRRLERELKKYQGEAPGGLKQLNEQLLQQLDEAKKRATDLQTRCAGLQDEFAAKDLGWQQRCDKLRQDKEALAGELEKVRDELLARDQADQTRENLIKKAMKLEGRTWERKVLRGIPGFRPLHERHAPVISVLNLKGGVGKTTVTAHLGAAFSAKGYRVLLMDLDLQGSLSSLFINETVLNQRSAARLLLRDYLINAAEKRKANLFDYSVPIFDGRSAIVPTADSMAYAELNLTMRWLLRIGKRDNRFLLRRALQQKRVASRYDIVLLDCPPILNMCCVNALTASDYVLIPVMPSNKAAERVPLLLERLKGLCRVINPELQVVGILLNRTKGAQLTVWEDDLWRDMLVRSQDRWKLPVHAFETFIRQTTEVRDSENEFSPPAPGSELHGLFSRLAAELEERLPRDCRRTTAAPLGSG